MPNKKLIVIAGPTAIGKTTTAINIAQMLGTEILSCDSRQLYKELNIGVAKPSESELKAIKHHFIDHISITEKYSAGRYERESIDLISNLFKQYDHLILTGGTGLYIKAVLEGLDEFPEVDPNDVDHYTHLLNVEGISALQNELKIKDPTYFREVDLNNTRRLVRSLSVIKSSGRAFSSFRNSQPKERDFETIAIQLTMDREKLYHRINIRVDQMMENGLLDEVVSLLKYRNLKSLQTVGYSELFRHLDGALGLNEAIELIKRNSRRYAKRQITWFSNNGDFLKIPTNDIDKISNIINASND